MVRTVGVTASDSDQPDCNIYGLFSSRDPTIRYIGQTSDLPEYRRDRHVKDARAGKKAPVAQWIRAELAQGHKIRVRTLDWYGIWGVSEQEYMALYRAMGAPLVNVRPGGGGPLPEVRAVPPSAQTRALMSKRKAGRKLSLVTRSKISAGKTNAWSNERPYAPVYDSLRWK